MFNSDGIRQFQELEKKPTPTISGFMLVIALADGIAIIISIQTEIRLSRASSAGAERGASKRATSECGGRLQTHRRPAAPTSLGLSASLSLYKVHLEVTILALVGWPKQKAV